jgi:hypothetical protein
MVASLAVAITRRVRVGVAEPTVALQETRPRDYEDRAESLRANARSVKSVTNPGGLGGETLATQKPGRP